MRREARISLSFYYSLSSFSSWTDLFIRYVFTISLVSHMTLYRGNVSICALTWAEWVRIKVKWQYFLHFFFALLIYYQQVNMKHSQRIEKKERKKQNYVREINREIRIFLFWFPFFVVFCFFFVLLFALLYCHCCDD